MRRRRDSSPSRLVSFALYLLTAAVAIVNAKITVFNSSQPTAPSALDPAFSLPSYQFFGWPELTFDTFSGPLLRAKFVNDSAHQCRLEVSFDGALPRFPTLKPLQANDTGKTEYAHGYTKDMRTSLLIWSWPRWCIGYSFIAPQLAGLKQTLQAANLPPPGLAVFKGFRPIDKPKSDEFGGPFGNTYGDPTKMMEKAIETTSLEKQYLEWQRRSRPPSSTDNANTGKNERDDVTKNFGEWGGGYPRFLDWHFALAADERLNWASANSTEPIMVTIEHDYGIWNTKWQTDDHVVITWVINGLNIALVLAMLVHVWITYGKHGWSSPANKRREQLKEQLKQQQDQQQQQQQQHVLASRNGAMGKSMPVSDISYHGSATAALSPRQHPYQLHNDDSNNQYPQLPPPARGQFPSHSSSPNNTATPEGTSKDTAQSPLQPAPADAIVHLNFYRVAMGVISLVFAIGLIPLPTTHTFFETWKITVSYIIAFIGYSSEIFLAMAMVHMMNSIYPRPILSRICNILLWIHMMCTFLALAIVPFARILEIHYPIDYTLVFGMFMPLISLIMSYGWCIFLSITFYRNLRRLRARASKHHVRDIHIVTIATYSAMIWMTVFAAFLALVRSYQLSYKLHRTLSILLLLSTVFTVASIFASIYSSDMARGLDGDRLEYWPVDAPPVTDGSVLDDCERQQLAEHQMKQEQIQQEQRQQQQQQKQLKAIGAGSGHVRQTSDTYTDGAGACEDYQWGIGMVPLADESRRELRNPLVDHLQQLDNAIPADMNSQWYSQVPSYTSFNSNALPPLSLQSPLSPPPPAAATTTPETSSSREADWVKLHVNNQY
ncbi:hypothetical protein GQ42DRAFT_154118 [Ramicandelaber brevisporus]|nr:hypothetical protein GQ42DRAFT_154118 [Ramicandelaber brevisporus]